MPCQTFSELQDCFSLEHLEISRLHSDFWLWCNYVSYLNVFSVWILNPVRWTNKQYTLKGRWSWMSLLTKGRHSSYYYVCLKSAKECILSSLICQKCSVVHLSAFPWISLHFSQYLCISLHFSEFLCISLHFSVFLYISLHFTFYILGQIDGAYRRPMDAICAGFGWIWRWVVELDNVTSLL